MKSEFDYSFEKLLKAVSRLKEGIKDVKD